MALDGADSARVPRARGDEPPSAIAMTAGSSAFPAPAGMNRWPAIVALRVADAFPAPAGMNRRATLAHGVAARVPRARGDEPPALTSEQ